MPTPRFVHSPNSLLRLRHTCVCVHTYTLHVYIYTNVCVNMYTCAHKIFSKLVFFFSFRQQRRCSAWLRADFTQLVRCECWCLCGSSFISWCLVQDLAPSACSEKVSSLVEHPQQWETSTSAAVIYTLLRRSPRLTLKSRSSAPAGSNQGHRNNPPPPSHPSSPLRKQVL